MDLQNNLNSHVLRASILSHFKTDNILVDLILGGILMTMMNKLMEWMFKLKPYYILDKLRHFTRWGKKNEVLLIRKEYISSNYWDNRSSYPKSILAVYNYINKKNIVKTGTMRHVEYKSKQLSDINFMVESKEPIKITDDIFFMMYWGEDGRLVSDNNKGERTVEHKYSLFSYTKSMRELMDFLTMCLEELEVDTVASLNNKPFYFMYDHKDENGLLFDEYSLDNDRSFDNIFFDQKLDIKNRLDFFINNREWYKSKGIPYTLGLMFSGKPGCGKTSTIKAIAKYTKRHVIDIPLAKIDSCRDLMNIFYGEEINSKKIPMNKRIYLFEDVDSILEVLKERENKEKENKEVSEDQNVLIQALISKKAVSNDKGKSNDRLNLGFFLNLIDGVLETPGRILILSTNHPEKLDRALVRPGRIDIKVHLEKCSKDMIRDILNHYYENDERVEESILDGLFDKDITPAELYQICFKYEKYNSFKNDILDNVDTVFNMYIDREEDEKLNNLLKISNINNKEPKSCSKLLKRNLKPIKHIKSNFMEVDNNNDIPDGDRHNNVNNYNSDSNSD
jgi:hypothetical protein